MTHSGMKDVSVWERIRDHAFDDGQPETTFAARLSREQRWSTVFTEAAILEYRRFIYLVAIAEESLTPSQTIDDVWHLHLCYTKNYWNELCRNVIGKPIHHSPSRGGKKEDQKYVEYYQKTRELYRHEFGEDPPPEYWPMPRANRANSPILRVAIPGQNYNIRNEWIFGICFVIACSLIAISVLMRQKSPGLAVGILVAGVVSLFGAFAHGFKTGVLPSGGCEPGGSCGGG